MRETRMDVIETPGNRGSEPRTASLESEGQRHDRFWLHKAEQCHHASTDFMDANIRTQWEKNIAHFNSQHAKDSRFYRVNYRSRNKLFEPKTRTIAIKSEAAVSKALFSTADLTSIKATDEADEIQNISAEINQNLLQFRLTETIPWYLTAIGAWQDTGNYGICISYQYWNFETRTREVEVEGVSDGETGEQAYDTYEEVIKDEPAIDLLPPENFRFDVAADWRDVIGTSSFLERLVPLPAHVVLARMASGDSKTGKKKWKSYTLGQIISASTSNTEEEQIRRARQGRNKHDPLEKGGIPRDYEIIWCREYFVRDEGTDWVYWTIGHTLLLTDPEPIEDVYFHGERPFTIGMSLLEAHKTYPAGRTELLAPIQVSINQLLNQRRDNVDLVLNKRYFLRRGQNIDSKALMRNVPGGGVYMDNPESDVKIVTTPDVTSSSYEEHNRLSNQADELAGNFSSGSVEANQNLNKTVGGMAMARNSSDDVTEYAITVFIMTWVEPVLRQLMRLQQAYETNEVVLALAAGKSKAYQRINLNGYVPDELLQQKLNLTVDVGVGNLNPITKADNFAKAIVTVLNVLPEERYRMDPDAIIKEIMGGAGRKNGDKFFKPADESARYMQLAMQQVQQQMAEQGKQGGKSPEEMEFEKWKFTQEIMMKMVEQEDENEQFYSKLASEREMTLEKLYGMLGIEGQKLQQKQRADTMVGQLGVMRERNKANELLFKATSGRDGI